MAYWHDELTAALVPIAASSPVTGGDINHALRCELTAPAGRQREIFVKHNDHAPDGMFAAEARGLDWLRTGALRIPRVLAHGRHFLALELLPPGPCDRRARRALGAGLAALHLHGAPCFGLDHDNFIGPLPQKNRVERALSWPELWVEVRLAPMVERALALGRGDPSWPRALEHLRCGAARQLWPEEPPARLHGDLWTGNVLYSDHGPALIDPAPYGGHREIDLAMLALFGGLSDDIIDTYHAVYPLSAGWRERLELGQLYPLLVHTVLFGGGYAAQAHEILRRWHR